MRLEVCTHDLPWANVGHYKWECWKDENKWVKGVRYLGQRNRLHQLHRYDSSNIMLNVFNMGKL